MNRAGKVSPPSRWATRLLFAAVTGALALGVFATTGHADIKRSPAGHVELRGASSMQDFAQRAAEGFMSEKADTRITVSAGGPRRGMKSVLVGTADIALFTGDISDEMTKYAKDQKIQIVRRDVYRDGVVVVVHPSNPLADLPLWRIREIFRGAVTNWKELGGKDAPITVVSLDPSTGAYETFKKYVMTEGFVVTPKATTVSYREFDKSITENAIGYIGGRQNKFKAISVDGVAASPETLLSGKYPIQRHLSVVHRADASPQAKAFVDYLLAPDKGQAIVRAQGDIPVTP